MKIALIKRFRRHCPLKSLHKTLLTCSPSDHAPFFLGSITLTFCLDCVHSVKVESGPPPLPLGNSPHFSPYTIIPHICSHSYVYVLPLTMKYYHCIFYCPISKYSHILLFSLRKITICSSTLMLLPVSLIIPFLFITSFSCSLVHNIVSCYEK